MTRGQRLTTVITAIAAALLVGRGIAVLYVDHAWYASLGALTVWKASLVNTILLYGGAILVGGVFAFLNIFAVRKSVIALVLPTHIGNVEIGEEVPASRLILIAAAISIGAAIAGTFALPHWTTLALWRSHVVFGEYDPYFGLDLGFYVAWLPFESALYTWALVLYAIVSLIVIVLYALTPSLRWVGHRVRTTTYARRHLSVLGAILLLLIAWGLRLDAFRLLIHGSGRSGAFTSIDHQWIVSTTLVCSIITVAAAVVLVAAGWIGQTQTAFITVTGVLVLLVGTNLVLPWVARVFALDPKNAAQEAPYITTQRVYTKRAFPAEDITASQRYAADSALLAAAPKIHPDGGLPDVVYPGARGVAAEHDSLRLIQAPRVGGTWSKALIAWAEQNPHLLTAHLSANAAIVRHRNVRDRVRLLAPIFAQSRTIGARATPLGIMWIVDLYATSGTYPLSTSQRLNGNVITYRHHAATAYVSGATARVMIVPDSDADPITRAWFARHPGSYLTSRSPVTLTGVKPSILPPNTAETARTDSTFKQRIIDIYFRMRDALDSGDFQRFGNAFDSLGTTIGVH